ncbi:unnamed protein product [Gongylonema pulchrum]|uniref:Uncharacterized protein n=1 Tax=Gongylonema pulchrum TaxID=637853 RepID=A0A3P7ME90_9BILA|nr:unnamed protein product [Gongylonema pulchrum]
MQSSFAKHMIYLEEHREEDVNGARLLRDAGQELISSQDVELTASLLPKCDELDRMADALSGALERRSKVLRLSKDMHEQVLATIGTSWVKGQALKEELKASSKRGQKVTCSKF